ncbi:MAG: wax ester/triacylglycerol synthase family O-acyltransferase [Solirubrobacteraceae bacterium]
MSDTLTALDGTFLELEDSSDGALMHIGGVAVFDPLPGGTTPTLAQIRDLVEERLADLPRFRKRLSNERTARWSWPQWVDDEHFTVADHVGRAALPSPGGTAELEAWIADFYSHRLDRTRPLWEMVLLEGLTDGRWALAQKLHHCLVDGVGSVGVTELLLDTDPAPPLSGPVAPAPSGSSDSIWHWLLPTPPASVAQATRSGTGAATAALRAMLRPRETMSRSKLLAELILADEVVGAPSCSLNVAIGPSRRYAAVSYPLEELLAIRNALGGSMNDVVLSICTAGLRRLLQERGEELPAAGLRAMVPVNLRAAAESLSLGNRVGSLFVELPVAEPVAAVRHRQIVDATVALKNRGAGQASATLVDLAALAPPLVHASLARLLFGSRLFNLTITNVRGAQAPRYAFGARMRDIHPIVPLAAEHAVAIAVVSHDGGVTFGLNADRESTPDLAVLANGMREGFADLQAASGLHLPARKPGSRGRRVTAAPKH